MIKWSFDLHSPPWAGVVSTTGGLVIAGTSEDNFIALDARSGVALWNFQTGAPMRANPIRMGSEKYIAVAAGSAIYAFATTR